MDKGTPDRKSLPQDLSKVIWRDETRQVSCLHSHPSTWPYDLFADTDIDEKLFSGPREIIGTLNLKTLCLDLRLAKVSWKLKKGNIVKVFFESKNGTTTTTSYVENENATGSPGEIHTPTEVQPNWKLFIRDIIQFTVTNGTE